MEPFLHEDFLLKTEMARALFHNYAEKLPIIDYHSLISPREILEDRKCSNITEFWLDGDYYKRRTIRLAGMGEKYITGDASDYEKFKAYASVMPSLIGNPLYHWTHLELKRYFDCDLILSEKTADAIWKWTSEKLAEDGMSVRNLLRHSRVDLLCTTDDPADSLEYHKALAEDTTFETKVLPAFCPDKYFDIHKAGRRDYYEKLGAAAGVEITDVASLKEALRRRIDFFDHMDCRTAHHGLDAYSMFLKPNGYAAGEALKASLASDGADVSAQQLCVFKTEMLVFLAGEYKKHGWVMQIHTGAWHNTNDTMFKKRGSDTGFGTIGGNGITSFAQLFDWMNQHDALPRTILYSDPSDNTAIGTLLGCFETPGDGMPLMMQGCTARFNDTYDEMRAQMIQLANLSVFGKFFGVLTDSCSFTSYARHEYFRRILCDVIGQWVEDGMYPADMEALAQIVCDICYNNVKNFFGFKVV